MTPVEFTAESIRVYVPANATDLSALVEHGTLSIPRTVAAVTPSLREHLRLPPTGDLAADDVEWCEHAACLISAAAIGPPGAVVVADIAVGDVCAQAVDEPGLIDLTRPVPLAAVACAFAVQRPAVLDSASGHNIAAAADSSNANAESCDGATEASGTEEEVDLLWYGPTELADLATYLSPA